MSSKSTKSESSNKSEEKGVNNCGENEERGLLLPDHLEAEVKRVYEELKVNMKDLLDNGVNSATVLELTEAAMRIVGKVKNLVGYEKKAIVLSVVSKFVEESANDVFEKVDELSDVTVQELEDLRIMVDSALNPYVDQVYSLAPELYGKAKQSFSGLKAFFKKLSCV